MIIPALWRRPLTVAALWTGILLLAFDGWAALSLSREPAVTNDFRLFYMAARLVLERGWPALYDFAAQRAEAAVLGFSWQPFLNPPPMAALALPFAGLPFSMAVLPWTLILAGALVASVLLAGYGSKLERAAQLALVAGLFPVAFAIMVGQPPALVALALAASWWLVGAGRPVAGGAVLGLIALKPQLGFLVPLALLVSGRFRAAATAFGLLAALALLSAALLDGGIGHYLAGLREAAGWEISRRYAVTGVLLPTPWAALVEVAAAAVGLVAARRLRAHLDAVFAIGVAASLLVTPHIGIEDLTVLALAGLLLLRLRPPAWQAGLILAGYPLCEMVLVFSPAVLLAWRLAWLASLLLLRSDDLDRSVGTGVGASRPGRGTLPGQGLGVTEGGAPRGVELDRDT